MLLNITTESLNTTYPKCQQAVHYGGSVAECAKSFTLMKQLKVTETILVLIEAAMRVRRGNNYFTIRC